MIINSYKSLHSPNLVTTSCLKYTDYAHILPLFTQWSLWCCWLPKEIMEGGAREEKNTSFDNELLNHPYWKRSVLFGKCEILKDSFEQFELIRSYKIIFGKWHLSLDERIFFSDPKLMSFKWVFFPPLLPFCCARSGHVAWANSAIYGSVAEADGATRLSTLWPLTKCLEPFKRLRERDHILQNHCW